MQHMCDPVWHVYEYESETNVQSHLFIENCQYHELNSL